jgi:hypothetical protein
MEKADRILYTRLLDEIDALLDVDPDTPSPG